MLRALAKHLPAAARKTLKAVARRSLPYLPSSVRDEVLRASPSLRPPKAAQAADRVETPASMPAAPMMRTTAEVLDITPDLVGSTYDPAEVLPMLALENSILRSRLLAATPSPSEGAIPVDALEKAERAASEYLAGQAPAGDKVRHLVIANDYPDVGREYGNGFIHRRVKHYMEAGVHVDVVLAGYSVSDRIYEFDGVRVLSGKGPEISALLDKVTYKSVSVHFMNRWMWDYLEPHLSDIDLHVFLHGYECSRWIRTVYNYPSGTMLERGINRTIDLQQLWHEIVSHPRGPVSYIFVSDWWRQAVLDDMGIVIPAHRTHVIHNIVDSELFTYEEKPPEQRFNLLWVRSAANRKYGHDLAIDTIKRLSKTPHWDKARITIMGDGQHFADFEKELGHFSNVHIEQRFVVQEEVARLHKDHGMFLVPSRLDSQGVARDEAMSSGLVVATNMVTAIPEFVDETTAIVAEAERSDQLAEGIVRVWEDPDLFSKLSSAGSQRVQRQCGAHATVEREMELMNISAHKEA